MELAEDEELMLDDELLVTELDDELLRELEEELSDEFELTELEEDGSDEMLEDDGSEVMLEEDEVTEEELLVSDKLLEEESIEGETAFTDFTDCTVLIINNRETAAPATPKNAFRNKDFVFIGKYMN